MGERQRIAVSNGPQRHSGIGSTPDVRTVRRAPLDREPDATMLRGMMGARVLQPRLTVGPVDDPYEREAERAADILTTPDSAVRWRVIEPPRDGGGGGGGGGGGLAGGITRIVRRALGKMDPAAKKDDDEKKHEEHRKKEDEQKKLVQRSSAGPGPSVVPSDVERTIEALSAGGGGPLPESIRARFEPRFGYDFGAVRVHTNDRATGAATALGARAFTVGDHVFFAAGEYQPSSAQGQRLIAHELTHVVQQGADASRVRRRAILSWQVGSVTYFKARTGDIVELPEDMTVEQVAKIEDEAIAAEKRLAAELPKPKPVPDVHKPSPKPAKTPPSKPKLRARRPIVKGPPKLAETTAALLKAVGGGKVAQYLAAKGAPVFAHGLAKLSTLKAHEQTHEASSEKLKHSEDAVVIPPSEEQATGNAGQVSVVGDRPAPVVDENKGRQRLDQSLAANIPPTIGALDNFQRDKKGQHTAAEVLEVVQGDKNATVTTFGDVKETPPPVPSGHVPVKLPPPEGAPATASMNLGRGAIAPLLKEHTDVSEYTSKADAKLKEEGITQEQLDMVDSGDLAEANMAKKGMAKVAATEPLAVQKMANDERTRVDKELTHEEHAERAALAGKRKSALHATGNKQRDTRTALEKKRDDVAKEINDRYKAVQDKVTKRLAALDTESMKRFDDGNTTAARDFEANVKRELDAYKADRYSGWFGWARKAKDWLLGMDRLPTVKLIFERNRDEFQRTIQKLVDDISADNARVIRECHEELTTAKQKIDEFVAGLDPQLQDIGRKAAAEMSEQLAELDKTVSRKEEELKNKLKDKQTAAIKAIDEKIEKMKQEMSGALAKVGRLLLKAAKKFFSWALEKFGLSLSTIENIIDKGIAVLKAIFTHPIQFVKNLIGAAKTGFSNFAKHFLTHLKDALFEWLTGSLEGITLPESWTVRGIVSVLFQLVGITWAHLKAALVKLIPAPVVEGLQTTFGLVKTLVTEGPMAAWEQIKDMGEELKRSFVSALTDWLKWKVIEEAVKTIIAMFIPGAGIIRAIVAIYDTIVFFIQKAREIMEMIGNFLGSIGEIAAGNIGAAADALENGLARGLKLVIAFLAKFLHLDGITARIRAVIQTIRGKVDAVLDRVAAWVVGMAKKAGKLVGKAGEQERQKDGMVVASTAPLTPQQASKVKAVALNEAEHAMRGEKLRSVADMHVVLTDVHAKYKPAGLKSLSIRVVDEGSLAFNVIATASEPEQRTIRWDEAFAPDDEAKVLFKTQPRFETNAAVSVNGTRFGETVASSREGHAEQNLIARYWNDIMKVLGDNRTKGTRSTVVLAINRAPCHERCTGALIDAIRQVPGPVRSNTHFILAPSGTYEPTANLTDDEVEADARVYEAVRHKLRSADHELEGYTITSRATLKEHTTRMSDLVRLSDAGWDIRQLAVRPKPTSSGVVLAEAAHKIAVKAGRVKVGAP